MFPLKIIIYIILSACIDAVAFTPKRINSGGSLLESSTTNSIKGNTAGPSANARFSWNSVDKKNTRKVIHSSKKTQRIDESASNAGHSIPKDNLRQIFQMRMSFLSFDDAYDTFKPVKTITVKKVDKDGNIIEIKEELQFSSMDFFNDKQRPLHEEELDVLAFHNAELDNQYALREWMKMPSSSKKSFILKKLLENPTVDFKMDSNNILKESIKLREVDNFKTLYDKIAPEDFDAQIIAQYAAKNGQLDIFKYLIDEKNVAIKDRIQLNAAKSGNIDLVKYLLDEKNLKIDRNIQLDAALSGNLDMVKYILDEKNVIINQNIQLDAAKSGNLDMVEYILDEKNVPINQNIQLDAATSGNLEMVRYILDEKNVPIFETIQFSAARSGNMDLVKYLLDDKKVPILEQILEDAVKSKNLDLVKYLIEQKKVRINFRTEVYKGELGDYLQNARKRGPVMNFKKYMGSKFGWALKKDKPNDVKNAS